MQHVWILTVGEYSDVEAAAVFSSEETARQAEHLVGGYVTGPFVLDDATSWPQSDRPCFKFQMTKAGKVNYCQQTPSLNDGHYNDGVYGDDIIGTQKRARYEVFEGGKNAKYEPKHYWRLQGTVYAKDEQHAIKIINEVRSQILAGAKPKEGGFSDSTV